MLAELLRSLAASEQDIADKTRAFTVIADNKRIGPWRVAKAAWEWGARQDATHHLVIQDDVSVALDFIECVVRLISLVPDKPIALYDASMSSRKAREKGSSWIVHRDVYVGGQALLLPTPLIHEFLRWEKGRFKPEKPEDDQRIGAWAYLTGHYFWVCAPSIVDHAGEAESVIGHRSQSWAGWFIGSDTSALSVDWTLGLSDPPESNRNYPTWFRKMLARQSDG